MQSRARYTENIRKMLDAKLTSLVKHISVFEKWYSPRLSDTGTPLKLIGPLIDLRAELAKLEGHMGVRGESTVSGSTESTLDDLPAVNELLESEVETPVEHKVGADSQKHYTVLGVEPLDVIKQDMPYSEAKGFLKGNVIKYILRAPYKGQEESDYEKAMIYSKWLYEHVKEFNEKHQD